MTCGFQLQFHLVRTAVRSGGLTSSFLVLDTKSAMRAGQTPAGAIMRATASARSTICTRSSPFSRRAVDGCMASGGATLRTGNPARRNRHHQRRTVRLASEMGRPTRSNSSSTTGAVQAPGCGRYTNRLWAPSSSRWMESHRSRRLLFPSTGKQAQSRLKRVSFRTSARS